jgi:predicted transposase/invertase (TIGR01784 family)
MTRELISFDWAIKKILRSKANFGILEGFLSELLFSDITILEVLESESNKEEKDDKYSRVDIKVKDGNNRVVIIEVQYSRELDYLQRILYGSAKAISEHMKQGNAYSNVSKVISVSILYVKFGNGDDYIYHGTTRFIGLHNHTELQLTDAQRDLYKIDGVADIYPEYYLIELRNFDDIAKDTLDEWIYFLKNEKIEEKFTAKGLQQARETLDVMKMSAADRLAYEQHQKQLHHEASLYESTYVLGHLQGEKKGREEGMTIGVHKGLLMTAGKMKKAGMECSLIAEVTGLSVEQIESLE